MSFTISDTTYAGEAASGFITKAITGADTVQGGHVYVKDGIKKKFTIPRYDLDNIIQDRQATPNSSQGDQTVDGKVLDPQDYMIYFEFNPRDFEDHWHAVQLDKNLIDRKLPVTAESIVIQEVLKQHSKWFDRAIWQGNQTSGTAPYDKFNGLIVQAKADADLISVSSPITLTAANIKDELERGYVQIPNELLYDVNLKIFVSYKTAELYRAYQQAQANKGVDVTSAGVMRYNGKRVVPVAGFPDDAYMISLGSADMDSNLWVGVNSREDETNIKLDFVAKNSELMFVKVLCKAETNIAWGGQTIYYGA